MPTTRPENRTHNRLYSVVVLNWLRKKLTADRMGPIEQFPQINSTRTHTPLMKTSAKARSNNESMLSALSAKDLAQLNQNASEQLREMQKDPEEWESFMREIDLFSNGYFSRGE